MDLINEFNIITSFCRENDILLVPCDIKNSNHNIKIIYDLNHGSLLDFLNLIKKLKSITLFYNYNSLNNFDDLLSPEEQNAILKSEYKDNLIELNTEFKKHTNKIYNIEISFFNNSIQYYLYIEDVEITDFINDVINLNETFNSEYNLEFENKENQINIKPKKLTTFEIDKIINESLKIKEIISASNIQKRKSLLLEYYNNYLNNSNIDQIILKLDIAIDRYLKSKTNELKNKGLNKVQICSELGISKDRLIKYY